MQLYIKSSSFFFFVLIMIFLPLTFAPWSDADPPGPPTDAQPRTCPEWMEYHGFILGTHNVNRDLASRRAYKLDKDASTVAAVYAFFIDVVEQTHEHSPESFCQLFKASPKAYLYSPLKDEERTCAGWIRLYMFSPTNATNNLTYALNQIEEKKQAISIWADSYSRYLAEWKEEYAITPHQFCLKLGKTIDVGIYYFMNFMSENETFMTCEVWIKLYGFTFDVEANYSQAIRLNANILQFHIPVQYWAKEYANFIEANFFSGMSDVDLKPQKYCTSQNEDITATYNYYYIPEPVEDG